MGVKAVCRNNGDAAEPSPGHYESASGSFSGGAARLPEKSASRRKVMEKSILDDIMGDPEDFRDLADCEAGSESDGGRWEDAVRAALENEDAAVGACLQETNGIENGLKVSGDRVGKKTEKSSDLPTKDRSHGPSSSEDRGAFQSGRIRQHVSHERDLHGSSLNGTTRYQKVFDRRYFIIKSLNHHNIAKSIEKGIWATQAMNEPVLNEAFETTDKVILVFSVNMSGHFQGYAQMVSPIGRRRADVWSETANDGVNPWGGFFCVEWLRLYDLPFQKTVHLKNPLNYMKPVKISRDCQELTQDIGDALCALIDEGADQEGRPKRKSGGMDIDFQGSKRLRGDPVIAPSDAPHRPRPPVVTHMPMMYGSPQGVPHEPHVLPGSSGNRPMTGLHGKTSQWELPRTSKSRSPLRISSEKLLERDRDRNKDRYKDRQKDKDMDKDGSRQSISSDKSDMQDDDLLDMTYEEYLQRHGHVRDSTGYQHSGARFQPFPPSGPYGTGWMAAGGMSHADEQYANYIANWYGRQGPMMSGDGFYGSHGMGPSYPGMRPPDPYWHGKPDDMLHRRASRSSEAKSCSNGGFLEKSGRASH